MNLGLRIQKLKQSIAKRKRFTLWLSLLLLTAPQITFASSVADKVGSAVGSAITNVLGGALGWVAYGLCYIMAMIVGFFIGIAVYIIGIMVQLNTHIVNSPMVQTGFSITLAVANLAFVAGIIVIALMTILRQENYGVKKLLWKLVVMAILVNFGLVIAGVLINFADQITLYFLAAFPNPSGGTDSFTNFASNLAGAFAPQRALLNGMSTSGGSITYNGTTVSMGSSLASLLTPIYSILFTALMLFVILVSFLTLEVMFLLRYLWLCFLLVLLPLGWVGWVFPSFKSKTWDKWWEEFIRWCFFGPAVMFFLWLSVFIAGIMSKQTGNDPTAGLSAIGYVSTGANTSAFSSFLQNGIGMLVGTFLNMVVVVGIAIGGMIAANSMGIKLGGQVAKGMTAAGKAAGIYTAKTTARLGARAGAGVASGVGTAAQKTSNVVGNLTGVPRAGAWVGSKLKGGAQSVSTGLKGVADSKILQTSANKAGSLTTPGATGIMGRVIKPGARFAWRNTAGLGSVMFTSFGKGSGLFKKDVEKEWECQNCATVGLDPAKIVKSKKKPTIGCDQCHADVATANWKEKH